jgi:hypothetical protein
VLPVRAPLGARSCPRRSEARSTTARSAALCLHLHYQEREGVHRVDTPMAMQELLYRERRPVQRRSTCRSTSPSNIARTVQDPPIPSASRSLATVTEAISPLRTPADTVPSPPCFRPKLSDVCAAQSAIEASTPLIAITRVASFRRHGTARLQGGPLTRQCGHTDAQNRVEVDVGAALKMVLDRQKLALRLLEALPPIIPLLPHHIELPRSPCFARSARACASQIFASAAFSRSAPCVRTVSFRGRKSRGAVG